MHCRPIVFCSRNDFQHQTESLRVLTVSAAGYIAAADAEGRSHLALGLRQAAGKSVPAADHLRLPVRKAAAHQLPDAQALLPIGHIREHGVVAAHHIHEAEGAPGGVGLDGIGQGHLPLQLFAAAKIHEHLIRYPLLTDT